MFLVNPGVWIGSTVLLLVILMAISIVPLFGQIAAHLLVPLFGAGMIKLCRRLAVGEEPEIADLFAGFRHNAGQLVMVGVFFAIGIFGIAFIAFLLVSGGVLGGVVTGKVAGFGIAFGGIMLAGLLVLVLSVPVIMATWFAPALVFFHDMQPLDAMKASFAAGAKNFLPMAIFWWSPCSLRCCRLAWGCYCCCQCFRGRSTRPTAIFSWVAEHASPHTASRRRLGLDFDRLCHLSP